MRPGKFQSRWQSRWLWAGAILIALAAAATQGRADEPGASNGAERAAEAGSTSASTDTNAGSTAAGAGPARAPAGHEAPILIVAPVEVQAPRERAPADADAIAPGAARGLEDTAFVTEVRVRDRAAETASVAEVLARTMGVSMRSLGGLGSFSSVSVRGADPGNTAVFVDGVPLSRIASATVNLERFALESFSALELYRGGVPVELGSAALGGALRLRTRVGVAPGERGLAFGAGAGSFGARRLHARWLGGDERRGHHLALAYAGAAGDFSYFNDNGTNLDPGDDRFATRENNGFDRLDAVARKRWQRGALAIEAGGRWSLARQGIPGSGSVQASQASLTTVGQLVDVKVTRQGFLGSPRLAGTAGGFADLSWQHYRDPAGEIGIGQQDRRYRSVSAGASGQVHADLGAHHLTALGADLHADHFRERDALAVDDTLRSHGMRLGAAASASHEWTIGADERVVLRPALRLDWLRTAPLADRNTAVAGDGDLAVRDELFLGPRLAARVRLTPGVALKGSAGRYFRPPTVLELFGDRGFLVGDPTLPSETGLSADAGMVIAPLRAVNAGPLIIDQIYLESALFARRSRHTIGFVTTGGVSGARDLGDATARGVEAGAALRLARTVTLGGNYTWLDTRQDSPYASFDGKPLPNRPRHQIYARVDMTPRLGDRRAVVWGDVQWTSGNVLDRAAQNPVPARELVGAGIKLEIVPGVLLGIEAKNLSDHRVEAVALDPPPRPDLTDAPRAVADFFGHPLPGRAFYVTAEWQP